MILGPNGQPVSSSALRGGDGSRPGGRDGTHQAPRRVGSEHAFEAAKRVGYKGWFWFPTLDASEQMPRMTRETIAEKAWWLYNNVDVTRLVIDGLSLDEVDGGMWPKAATSSAEFNRAATDLFHEENGDSQIFDSADSTNFYGAQFLIRRSVRLFGELFAQMLEPGPGSPFPCCHFVNPWQLGNAVTKQDQSRWDDGIYFNRLGRPLQYRFKTNKQGTAWVDVSRENVLHFHDQLWVGQRRGMSALAPVVRKLFSIDEIERSGTASEKLRKRMAYAITRGGNDDGGGPVVVPGAQIVEEVTQEDGSKLIVQKVLGGDGNEVDVADVPAGWDLKVVESSQQTNAGEWSKYLLTGVAAATLYPADYVFSLGGITNGTLVRLVQKRVQRIKNSVREFQMLPQFGAHWYRFWIWQRIKAGAFAGVEVPDDWYKVKWIRPADDTVDVGREGRLHDDRYATGKMSGEDYHGLQGRDEGDVEDEQIAARERREEKLARLNERRKKAGLDPLKYEDLWPRSVNTPTPSGGAGGGGAGAAARPGDDPDDDPDPDDDDEDDNEDEDK